MLITADTNIKALLGKPAMTPFVAKIDEWNGRVGIYLAVTDDTGEKDSRFFAMRERLYVEPKSLGDSWRDANLTLEAVAVRVDDGRMRLAGAPVLVQLDDADDAAYDDGTMPPARFRGQGQWTATTDSFTSGDVADAINTPDTAPVTAAVTLGDHEVPSKGTRVVITTGNMKGQTAIVLNERIDKRFPTMTQLNIKMDADGKRRIRQPKHLARIV